MTILRLGILSLSDENEMKINIKGALVFGVMAMAVLALVVDY